MASLESQYRSHLEQNPEHSHWTYEEWLKWHGEKLAESIRNSDLTISDNFQIGPDGAFEADE